MSNLLDNTIKLIRHLDEPALYIAEGVPCQNEYYKIAPSILSKG